MHGTLGHFTSGFVRTTVMPWQAQRVGLIQLVDTVKLLNA
jgi:hypothetical protein